MGGLILAGIVVMLIFALHRVLVDGKRGDRYADPTFGGIPGGELKRLRSICRGDLDRMAGMLEYEKRRCPGINNQEACSRAITSFMKDNR